LNLFQVNPSGPLRDLKNLLFGGGLVNTLKEFLTKHWYVGIAAGVGLIIIMVSLKRQLQLHIYYYGKSKKTITTKTSQHGTQNVKTHNRIKPKLHFDEDVHFALDKLVLSEFL
jgi:hypothetical protein